MFWKSGKSEELVFISRIAEADYNFDKNTFILETFVLLAQKTNLLSHKN